MKTFKRVFAILMSAVLLVAFSAAGLTVSAAEDPTESVDGIRWFPANMERNNGFDDIWEVETADQNGGVPFQRFNEADSNPDALETELSTEYDENGALTITRTGKNPDQANNDLYWPRIRTIGVETSPSIDLTKANTLYYDFTATENWNIDLMFMGGMELKLAKAITEANGGSVENTDGDGPAGTYQGSINLIDTMTAIADATDPHSTEASSILNMASTAMVPQIIFFVVGSVGASCTINSLYIAPEGTDDPTSVPLMDMGLVYGDSVYESEPDDGGDAGDAGDSGDSDDGGADTATEPGDNSGSATTTTKAPASSEGGMSTWMIVAIVAAVVVVAVIIICVAVVQKKKKKGTETK